MTSRFKTSVIATIVAGLLLTGSMPSQADPNDDQLPDIGTTAGNTLSINQELAMGDFTYANSVPVRRLSTIPY